MSFELYLQSADGEADAEIPFELIEQWFGPFTERRWKKCWSLRYPDGGGGDLYMDTTGANVKSFMAARPPCSPEFWQTLFNLLERVPSCLFWPGGGLVIANAAVRERLSPDMIACLGEPILVTRPEQILEAISSDGPAQVEHRDERRDVSSGEC